MLLRKYVHELLSSYYKQPHNAVVGAVQVKVKEANLNPINFRWILGKWHWQLIHRHLYQKQTGQWLTPVELFRPYYSRIIANFVATEATSGTSALASAGLDTGSRPMNQNEPLEIIEIGGGRGTNALCIIDHLQRRHPNVYERLESYTIMDSSPTLLDLMDKTLIQGQVEGQRRVEQSQSSSNGNGNENGTESNRHFNKVRLKQIDMIDVAEKRSILKKSNRQTIFIAMEVLDNLAHDKVTLCETSGAVLQGEIQHQHEHKNEHEHKYSYPDRRRDFKDVQKNELEEIFRPLSDDLLKYVLKTQPLYLPTSPHSNGTKWIPTVACGMIQGFLKSRKNSSAILADFDWLPPPQFEYRSMQSRRSLGGEFEPLVTCMDDVDHICYLNSPELCDILFPTSFPVLCGYVENLLLEYKIASTVNSMKQNDFLDRYGKEEIDCTRGMLTGYTPLLEDFSNCSVLTVTRGTK